MPLHESGRWEFLSRVEVSPTGTLVGYAAIFDVPTARQDQFPGTETIARGAFTQALADPNLAARATVDHSLATIGLLGTTAAGTLQLTQDEKGLKYEILLPNTQTGNDMRELVNRGDVQGASFLAKMDRSTIERTADGVVHHNFPQILDVCITAMPAYPETSVAARTSATPQSLRAQLASIRANVLLKEMK